LVGFAGGFSEDLGDGGDGGLGEEVVGGGVGEEETADFEVEFAVGAAGFFEEVRSLVGGLVEDELEEALDLCVALGCHAPQKMVTGKQNTGHVSKSGPGGLSSEEGGFRPPMS
jgi:hypothetical protein